ncbi:hypothetical protein TNCV_2688781 [Trichonephila clavipes]|nr:hypothetical protein TNCV_2688781 [Trichonephila clavipes]
MCGLSFINNIRDLAVSEIWVLTDSRSSIQHLSNWPSIGDSTSRSILHLFNSFRIGTLFIFHTVVPFSYKPSSRNEVTEMICGRTSNPLDPEKPHGLPHRLNLLRG